MVRLGVVGRGGLVVSWSGEAMGGGNVRKRDDPHLGPGRHHVLLHRVARLAGVPVRLTIETYTVDGGWGVNLDEL